MLKNFFQARLPWLKSGGLTEPIWDPTAVPHPYPSNEAFVRDSTVKLLSSSYPNMTIDEATAFLNGLLIQYLAFPLSRTTYVTSWYGQRNSLLRITRISTQKKLPQKRRYRQRALSIPGLIAPNEILEEMLDS
ncbi:hypothetical protein Droror1_Dr00012989 [Drosera rotundifolia]